MNLVTTKLNEKLSVTSQISVDDLAEIAAAGYQSVICNRPDQEGGETQPTSTQLEQAARSLGINFVYLPVEIGAVSVEKSEAFNKLLAELPGPVLAFCKTGSRPQALYQLAGQAQETPEPEKPASEEESVTAACSWTEEPPETIYVPPPSQEKQLSVTAACNWGNAFDIVVVGGGSAGIGVTASLLHRRPSLRIAIIEPSDKHYYQPAWTLVGGGAYDIAQTVRDMADVIPPEAEWIQAAASGFDPDNNLVHLADGRSIGYRQLIVCPGIRLAWEKIEGIQQTLGQNGVTSNYQFELAPYTWTLTKNLKSGKALFTQPPMPIKCAGAPQKAMYLSCDYWLHQQTLDNIEVEFHNAGAVLFGVADFVPPLMEYVKRYHAQLVFNSNLVKVDGANKIATFEIKDNEGNITRVEKPFDMLHVTPPQAAPYFLSKSPLADASGYCEVNPKTLQHPRYPNIFSLGDACSSPNTKTAAAARKQIVIVAENLLAAKEGRELPDVYDGYGACPLTVEKGKVILAEFGFGGKLLPTFPLDPLVARRLYWLFKVKLFPWLYWNGMLKGREWLARVKGTN
ncbi:bifunctional protein tyrosine phosphatase family protein/NAD(P)/FAD-dependent oxidoreductase [Nitrosomonas sp. Nm132]|uniref:bifunctional protein tyrosine phosphatase family protein/NAD(P)/FAD-dependent oxidoreductase n=1 Tax=Nitrosomonas sp. Nm132 TaxID=1881053 RepID=UPI00088A71D3|nr:bifunctional protein tyrosine phosphatase family protein/NAD(P)/FAD-dependent oxidoreductase [Nitrosomonas sp. Nm132]SDG92612.1 sulfide:quinone oxidoreductase [Nitrosomonas sp. Nm132]